MTSRKTWCCELDNVCGYTLKQGCVFVGFASLLIAVVTLFASMGTILAMAHKNMNYNSNSINAINMIFALFCTSTSLYQVTISIMLLWFTLWKKGAPFVITLWFVSHLSILTLYCFMFTARSIICMAAGHYMQSLYTAVGGFIYHGVFIYFSMIVNSYDNSLDPDTIFY